MARFLFNIAILTSFVALIAGSLAWGLGWGFGIAFCVFVAWLGIGFLVGMLGGG